MNQAQSSFMGGNHLMKLLLIVLFFALSGHLVVGEAENLRVTTENNVLTSARRMKKLNGTRKHLMHRHTCSVITTEVNITAHDNNLYALRLVTLFQHYSHRVYLVVTRQNPLANAAMLGTIARPRKIVIDHGLKLKRVTKITSDSIKNICPSKFIHAHISHSPLPSLANAAVHGIFIPIVQSNQLEASVEIKSRDRTNWLSYSQVWLPTWSLQVPYSSFIMPLVTHAVQWPLINSVVIPPNVPHNEAFLIRTLVLIAYGIADTYYREIFHRIPDIETALPTLKSSVPKYSAIIYEGRVHFALKGVCHNVMNALVPKGEWDLHIFHSNVNKLFVKSLFIGLEGVYLHNVDNAEISISHYNSLLTGNKFWRLFEKKERVLIFQTDSFFLRALDPSHLMYDYIGAPWCLNRNAQSADLHKLGAIVADRNMMTVGNGGLSIRNPKAMLRCINDYNAPANLGASELAEDVFFVVCMFALKMNIAPPNVAASFAIEQTPCKNYQGNRQAVIEMNTTALHAAWIHSAFRPGDFEKIIARYENIRNEINDSVVQ